MLVRLKDISYSRQSTNTLLILGQKLNPSGGHLRWLGNIKLLLLVKK